MRLLVLSDLHREIWCRDQAGGSKSGGQFPKIDLAISRPDVVILAGDIDVSDRAIAWADEQFDGMPVIYVHGNHEGYGHNLDEIERAITEACAATGHIHHLNRGELILGDTRFLGATLWTDFGLYGDERWKVSANVAGEFMNDYRQIRLADQGHRKLTPEDTRLCHLKDRSWLEGKLKERFAGWTVVVTHMAPSEKSIAERFRGDSLSPAFASAMDESVAKADLWIHGHVHSSLDYQIGSARVVCNPLGYPGRFDKVRPENPAFDANLVVTI